MAEQTLIEAVERLAQAAQGWSEHDLGQPGRWRAHREGVRFFLIGTYHELRELVVGIETERARSGPPVSAAQRTLAPYIVGYREFQALLLDLSDAEWEQEPAPGEWHLRMILAHIAGVHRRFFTLIHYALDRVRSREEWPLTLPAGETERVTLPDAEVVRLAHEGSPVELRAFFQGLHERTLREFAGITDEELHASTLWWEGEELPVQYRLMRFDAHLRQHTIQAEKTLDAIGRSPSEAKRLLRLVFGALGAVEAALVGAPETLADAQAQLARSIQERADNAPRRIAGTRALLEAIEAGDSAAAHALLAEDSELADTVTGDGICVLLAVLYRGQRDLAATMVEVGADVWVWEAAALGRLDKLQEAQAEWDESLNEFNRDGFTPLQLACFFGHEEATIWLLEQGADIHAVARNVQRITPLHAASANGNLALVEVLLRHGADPNARQQQGLTVLHNAADSGSLEMAQLLVAHGADVTLADDDGEIPLARAERRGHSEVAAWLRAQG